ncbi:MAG: hypothetical protein KTR18_05675 [Acidiferrobacterales bacterium]|nr:hypothetical protein [Acidiferrobacterales bacterium]
MIELIRRISEKAGVSQEVAEKAFDVVITEVKIKLPKNMADDLVEVMAGEKSYIDDQENHKNARYSRVKRSYQKGWNKLKSSVARKKS